MATDIEAIADRLILAADTATQIATLTAADPALDVEVAYAVLATIGARRRAAGWRMLGRKIGFTNPNIWPRYGVSQPLWAPMWDRTVHFVGAGGTLAVHAFTEPRIEPEVILKLRAPVAAGADAGAVLDAVDWIAAGFEIVQSPYPGWKFRLADCIAAFGLHAALVVGEPLELTPALRGTLVGGLGSFALTLARQGRVVDRGVGANVLGSPVNALAHLATLLASQPHSPPLAAGEIVTTGTITDAWPVRAQDTWSSDYGELGVLGPTLTIGS